MTEVGSYWMPDEGAPHARTWMSLGCKRDIWGKKLLPVVRRDVCRVAAAISRYEPVCLLVRHEDRELAKRLCVEESPGEFGITCVVAPLDDIWIRDTGPVFVVADADAFSLRNPLCSVTFNFNGWGKKQTHKFDAKVAEVVARCAKVPVLSQPICMEGGGIEVDGEGTAIITESCVLNPNRNPGVSKSDVEETLFRLLGLSKIIWLPGIAGKDITDGHTDFYARFATPGVVVAHHDPDPKSHDHAVTSKHFEILNSACDAKGRQLQVHVLSAPNFDKLRWKGEMEDFAAGYVNFYVCNGAVFCPNYGDVDADCAAKDLLANLFPHREVVQLPIDGIAAGGGGIHCCTQQQPSVGSS